MKTEINFVEALGLKNIVPKHTRKQVSAAVSRVVGSSVMVRPEGMGEGDLEFLGCYRVVEFDGVEYEVDCSHPVSMEAMMEVAEMTSGRSSNAITFLAGECLSTDRGIVKEVKRRVTEKLLVALADAAVR